MTRFAAVVLLTVFGVLIYWFSDKDRFAAVSNVFDALVSGEREIDQKKFRSMALVEVNNVRGQLRLDPLKVDPEMQDALDRFAVSRQNLSEVDLDTLFDVLRAEFPSAQFLSARLLLDPRESELVAGLRTWEDTANPDYESLNTLVFRDGLRQGCLAVLTRRLPVFDLGAANRAGGRFFNRCPHCGGTHGVELDLRSSTLILTCPDCSRPYDVIAADVDGEFRRATDFLSGFRIPVTVPVSSGKEKQLREIWDRVFRHCDYEYDSKGMKRGEAWKTPHQTWKDRTGDCEDTSILLADALISVGIDARVAVGWNVHIGQHAWCVAKLGDAQYVLETTTRMREDSQAPELLPAGQAAEEYRPEQMFDRETIFFRSGADRGERPCRDYWSESDWQTVPR